MERNGRVQAFHVPTVTAATLKPILEEQIAHGARLMTETVPVYEKIAQGFQTHETVNHGAGEYARGDVTTNTVEGYFGILKRDIDGIYQCVSPEHLRRYVGESSFRYNNRVALKIDDKQHATNALPGIEGKRQTYQWTSQQI